MNITVKSFQSQLDKAIKMGEMGLDIVIECYLYAQNPGRLKEIRKIQPDYTQEATTNAILRTWKIHPEIYLRIASKLGGGDIDTGRSVIKKFGSHECELAEKRLGATQLEKLRQAIPKMDSPSEFSAEVAKLRNELEEMAKENPGDGPVRPSLTWKQKFEKILDENTKLQIEFREIRKENEVLREQLDWFHSNSKVESISS